MTFHDMKLFPSKSQVHEMLHCASESSHRPNATYITFGEFCVFSSELKSKYLKCVPRPIPLSKMPDNNTRSSSSSHKRSMRRTSKSQMKYEVFLGGSCNPTTWRQDVAIPMLKSLGITYYNPQVTHWGPELIELESQAKQSAEVLFFVVDNQTRSVASIIECGHLSGCQRKLILVIKPYEGPGQLILGESLSEKEYLDLNHAQAILQDLVERQGIPVFDNIAVALNCTAKILREGLSVQDLELEDLVQPVKMAHVQLGDKLIKLRETFDSLDVHNSGQLTLQEVCMAFKILTNRELSFDELKAIIAVHKKDAYNNVVEISMDTLRVDFEQFCCLYTEFKNKKATNKSIVDAILSILNNIISVITTTLNRAFDWFLLYDRLNQDKMDSHSPTTVRDVYLGGSCGSSTWREDKAIPMLKKNGLTYFNPETTHWNERLIPIEAAAMENCRVLLFVITNSSRSLAAMALAAHYIGLGCNAVLCIQYLWDDCVILGEKMSQQAIKDYNRGRVYLSDLANREGIPVFDDICEAVNCAILKCRALG